MAHDKATGKETGDPEATMRAQIMQLVTQIEMGEQVKQAVGPRGAPQVFTHMPIQVARMYNAANRNAVSDW